MDEKQKKSDIYLDLEKICLMIITGGKVSDRNLKEILDKTRNEVSSLETYEKKTIRAEEGVLKEEADELKKIFSEGIKEFNDGLSEGENYFSDKNMSHIENCLDKALKGDEKIIYARETFQKKKNQENEIQDFLKSKQRQLIAKQITYRLSAQPFIHPTFGTVSFTETSQISNIESIKQTAFDLAGVPLFSGLGQGELDDISIRVKLRKYPANSIIFKENDLGKEIYIIKSGRVSIRKAFTGDLKEEEIAILGKGALIGEMSVIENTGRSATAKVLLGEGELYVISGIEFMSLLEKYPKISINLNKIYSHRLRETSKKLIKYLHEGVKTSEITFTTPVISQPVHPVITPVQAFLTYPVKAKPAVANIQSTVKTEPAVTEEKREIKKEEKQEILTVSSLKFISLTVKCRRFVYNKENISGLINETEKLLTSPENQNDISETIKKLENYKNMFSTEIEKLNINNLPPIAGNKFKEAKDYLLMVLSGYKKIIEKLLTAFEGKNINTVYNTREEINKFFEYLDNYLKLREEIKKELGQ